MKKILNFIGGEFVAPRNHQNLEHVNPATGQVDAWVPDSDIEDVEAALLAAQKAQRAWGALPAKERAGYLRRLGEGIRSRLSELARAESLDSGKPLTLAESLEIPRALQNFLFFADEIEKQREEVFETDGRARNEVVRSPLGIVVAISPWNLPLYLLTWKIAPALAAGNVVVAKPSELTPMTAFLLGEVARDSGLPPGVLNIVHGRGGQVGAALVADARIKAVTFTGSTQTGRSIAQSVAGHFKKLSLEMGGKNANIIFADCDFDLALQTTLRSSFQNQGQICLCGSRIFVERPLYERFKEALVERTRALKMGDPLDPTTEQGALVSEAHMNKVLTFIRLAEKEGGRILWGGKRNQEGLLASGFFVQPTLIEGLSPSATVNQEEIFGPVATLIPFDSEDQVVEWANGVRYGLSASIWSQDSAKARRVAEKLETGLVWINTWMLRDLRTPFGGVKESGLGREGGRYALEFMSEVKNICTKM
jgi:aminomuconate-semialdehyde/2-hydroxymuconate-6-semialdehyde dehydrogenase